jgi:hypothetical protein
VKVLDLFCGLGGWSRGFAAEGFQPLGIDLIRWPYPYDMILQDVRSLDGRRFRGWDVIIGSPPCRDFSTASQANVSRAGRKPPDPDRGLELVQAFNRVVEDAGPKVWLMENVRRMEKFYAITPVWRFKVSVRGLRTLWGNIAFPLSPQFSPRRKLEYLEKSYRMRIALRSEIPLFISRYVASVVADRLG